MKLTGDGKVYLNNRMCSEASWSISGNEKDLSITYSYNPDKAGYLHEFKLIDADSGLYHLITKNGYSVPNKWHTQPLLLIRYRTISAQNSLSFLRTIELPCTGSENGRSCSESGSY